MLPGGVGGLGGVLPLGNLQADLKGGAGSDQVPGRCRFTVLEVAGDRLIDPCDRFTVAEQAEVMPGQRVRAGRRDTEWPEFVFVTTGDGAGWVPERCLDTSSDPVVVLVGYDTTELATTAGEDLTLVERDDPSGWAWVRNAAGQEGWVPLRTVAPMSGA